MQATISAARTASLSRKKFPVSHPGSIADVNANPAVSSPAISPSLLSLNHPHVINVREMVVGDTLDKIFMVMDFMEHDLKQLMHSMRQPFTAAEVKRLMFDLCSALEYCHDRWVFHRDLKTSNLLMNNRGEVSICDFGLARYQAPDEKNRILIINSSRGSNSLAGINLGNTDIVLFDRTNGEQARWGGPDYLTPSQITQAIARALRPHALRRDDASDCGVGALTVAAARGELELVDCAAHRAGRRLL